MCQGVLNFLALSYQESKDVLGIGAAAVAARSLRCSALACTFATIDEVTVH